MREQRRYSTAERHAAEHGGRGLSTLLRCADLRGDRHHDRERSAEMEACEETHGEQRGERRADRRREREHAEQKHGTDEYRFAADSIGQPTAEARADHEADVADRENPSERFRRQPELGPEPRRRDADRLYVEPFRDRDAKAQATVTAAPRVIVLAATVVTMRRRTSLSDIFC